MPGETVEEQKPTVVAAASAAVEASAPVEPSPVQSPGQDEVCQFHSAVREKKRCRENGARKTQIDEIRDVLVHFCVFRLALFVVS